MLSAHNNRLAKAAYRIYSRDHGARNSLGFVTGVNADATALGDNPAHTARSANLRHRADGLFERAGSRISQETSSLQ